MKTFKAPESSDENTYSMFGLDHNDGMRLTHEFANWAKDYITNFDVKAYKSGKITVDVILISGYASFAQTEDELHFAIYAAGKSTEMFHSKLMKKVMLNEFTPLFDLFNNT